MVSMAERLSVLTIVEQCRQNPDSGKVSQDCFTSSNSKLKNNGSSVTSYHLKCLAIFSHYYFKLAGKLYSGSYLCYILQMAIVACVDFPVVVVCWISTTVYHISFSMAILLPLA